MNRHIRRAHEARTGDAIPPRPATPREIAIRVGRIDPTIRTVSAEMMPYSPTAILAFCQKPADRLKQEVVGFVDGVHILLIADNTPRLIGIGTPEPVWMLRGENGGPRDICRGIGAVVGFDRNRGKAVPLPVPPTWIAERLSWNPSDYD